MTKRGLYERLHPFDDYPFEVFYQGSWHVVERIRISSGCLVLHLLGVGYIFEDKCFLPTLRLRPRRASLSDCTCFLRSGIDICVMSPSQETNNKVWVEARIVSVERNSHHTHCECKFFIKVNDIEDHTVSLKGKLSKDVTEVGIHQIAIFQKFGTKPDNHNRHYRWGASEDCISVLKTRVLHGKFQADIAWMMVTSIHKPFVFDILSIENRIVYHVLDSNNDALSPEHFSAINFKMDGEVVLPVIVPFSPFNPLEAEEENDPTPLEVFCELRRSKRRHVNPDRYLGDIGLKEEDITTLRIGRKSWRLKKVEEEEKEMSPLLLLDETNPKETRTDEGYEKRGSSSRGRTKKYLAFYEYNEASSSKRGKKKSTCSSKVPQNKSCGPIQDDHHLAIAPIEHAHLQDEMTNDEPLEIDIPSKFCKRRSGKKGKGVARPKKPSKLNNTREEDASWAKKSSREKFQYWDDDNATTPNSSKSCGRTHHRPLCSSSKDPCLDPSSSSAKKKTLDVGAYKDLISAYMRNIQLTIENKTSEITHPFKQTSEEMDTSEDIEEDENEEGEEEEENEELAMFWKEAEDTLDSLYLERQMNGGVKQEVKLSETKDKNPCQHQYELDEEIGLRCSTCGHIETEIRDILPDFLNSTGWSHKEDNGGRLHEEGKNDLEHKLIDEVGLQFMCKEDSTRGEKGVKEGESSSNIWDLIPSMSHKLHPHQRKAYEFLWRNVGGSEMDSSKQDKIGGCVISHTPGAGKTFLIIAFLASYLKVFPGKRPLVLAPKTTLYTWYKEIIKWQLPIQVYQIHGRRTYKDRIYRKVDKNSATPATSIVSSGDVMHVLDCLEKLQKWHAHPSVLLMGYTSFMTMMRDDTKYAYRRYMGQLLRESPGILILDEGHNPRSTRSRLRKALMRVDTDVRILLSGTLFQNNFGEYFNTLTLARPSFVDEVLHVLDPEYKRKVNESKKSRITIESRARRVFMDTIASKINSGDPEERVEGLNQLKDLTNKFIDVYESGSYENLPGLQSYTLMMKPTPIQHKILVQLHTHMTSKLHCGFPLELELMITLGSIHPWLIRAAVCANKFLTEQELVALEEHKLDPTKGSKVKFVLTLIHKSMMRKEKVLVFCHNIAPITLFVELLDRLYGWRKGEEVLVLSGDLELFERGRVIDKFEDRASPAKVMFASINACAEGISLTAASRVVLLDSEWNPSKQKQAIARAFRPGQEKVVYVYQLLAKETLEEDKYGRTTWKEWVSSMILSEELVEDPSRWQAEKIEDELLREIVEEDHAHLFHTIMKNEKTSYENPLKVNG